MGAVDIKTLLYWVYEAQSSHAVWQALAWRDWEFRDGKQWDESDYRKAIANGINPLTINRIFPVLNLIYGTYIRSMRDIIAKGRTKYDVDLAQVMSEALSYVRDQNDGSILLSKAFNDEITAGIGFMEVCQHHDPRKEPVRWLQKAWYEVLWDPYAPPTMDKEVCRYAFTHNWTNLDNLVILFPNKRQELENKFAELVDPRSGFGSSIFDPSEEIEFQKRYMAPHQWANSERRRVKPVEMWYTDLVPSVFAIMPDTRVIEIGNQSVREQVQILTASREIVKATVKKMRVSTFVGDLVLQDTPTPYAHDEYPFVPFVGYTDRFGNPFGVPRQIGEQNMEVNKRRSMALALIGSQRIIVEEDVVKSTAKLYKEANHHKGLIVVNKNKLDKIEIKDRSELAGPQIELMKISEREIQEIAGATDEALSSTSYLQSAVGLEKKQEITGVVTAQLFNNAASAQLKLGKLTMSIIQSTWTGPKVLRVVDRLSGFEKFVEINTLVNSGGAIHVTNDITQGMFDMVLDQTAASATIREKNMELLFGAINKATPEAIGPLLNLALEISDLPEKEELLRQIRLATGMPAFEDNLSAEERDAKYRAQQDQKALTDQRNAELEHQTKQATIDNLIAQAVEARARASKLTADSNREDWAKGFEIGQTILNSAKGTEVTNATGNRNDKSAGSGVRKESGKTLQGTT